MAGYTIKQAPLAARIGTGVGQGLAEQVPKEIERHRLASGLEALNQKKNMSPFEQFTGLVKAAHEYPSVIQGGSELLKQQARANAFGQSQNRKAPLNRFPEINQSRDVPEQRSQIPSTTSGSLLEKVQEGYIPPTIEDRDEIASQVFNSNPARFDNDPNKAIEWANQKIAQEEKIDLANQSKYKNLSSIQENIIDRLKNYSDKLNTKTPADLYSRIEDKAIKSTMPIKQGGRGLSEQQAAKEYTKELDDASRLFQKIPELGNLGIALSNKRSLSSSIRGLQNEFEKIDQTDNFAKKLQSENGFSPPFSYAMAQPVYKVPEAAKIIQGLPDLQGTERGGALAGTVAGSLLGGIPGAIAGSIFGNQAIRPKAIEATAQIAPQLAEIVRKNEKASPLAIAHELAKKGYDPQTWLSYLVNHSDDLNLRSRQSEQANTPYPSDIYMNDYWLSSFSGLE